MSELPTEGFTELVPLRAGHWAYGGIRASSPWSRGCGDAKLEEIEEGTSDIMRLIISKSM
jgi:alkylation response protein AidB-like acyl-CoA dehydrogenase